MDEDVKEKFDYKDRAAKILPEWSYWGEGIVLVKREQWERSERKIISMLKNLRKLKKHLRGE